MGHQAARSGSARGERFAGQYARRGGRWKGRGWLLRLPLAEVLLLEHLQRRGVVCRQRLAAFEVPLVEERDETIYGMAQHNDRPLFDSIAKVSIAAIRVGAAWLCEAHWQGLRNQIMHQKELTKRGQIGSGHAFWQEELRQYSTRFATGNVENHLMRGSGSGSRQYRVCDVWPCLAAAWWCWC